MDLTQGTDRTDEVTIPVELGLLEGTLTVPQNALGVVLLGHSRGRSRHSPRNRLLAEHFHRAQLGTLLFDLLTRDEAHIDEVSGELRIRVPLLTERLIAATEWVTNQPQARHLRLGYFGASTTAAAALAAAADMPFVVAAVVSRAGRPDLAGSALGRVVAPTLFLVGDHDIPALEISQRASALIHCERRIEIVPGAGHLFAEPGAIEAVAALAARWFQEHFRGLSERRLS